MTAPKGSSVTRPRRVMPAVLLGRDVTPLSAPSRRSSRLHKTHRGVRRQEEQRGRTVWCCCKPLGDVAGEGEVSYVLLACWRVSVRGCPRMASMSWLVMCSTVQVDVRATREPAVCGELRLVGEALGERGLGERLGERGRRDLGGGGGSSALEGDVSVSSWGERG
jgi:hypothetical protein